MTTAPGLATKPDPPKRYRAECPVCSYFAERSKRAAAEWVLSQHVAYSHSNTTRGGGEKP
jgi:hypothetical protein